MMDGAKKTCEISEIPQVERSLIKSCQSF